MKKFSIRAFFVFSFLLAFCFNSQAQYFSVGNDPAKLKWEQIQHDNFRLIYPIGSKALANRFSSLLTEGMESIGASLEHLPRRFPMVIHSYSSTSNGYTIWAPRRIEMFPRPPIIGSSESYTDHLLVHEVRHMIQMDKLNVGITKTFSYFIGEQATAAVIGLHLPSWYMEGDAVLTETLLSNSGRGRNARFSQGLRSLWLENTICSFDKAMFGSYKDFTPNHYVMGYNMVAMSRLLGGPLLWADILDKTGRRPYTVSLLSRSLKNEIGLYKKELYNKTVQWAINYWKSLDQKPLNSPILLPVQDTINYINYLKPYRLENGDIITLKSCLGRIPEFVRVNGQGEESHLAYPGYIESASFSVKENILVWSEAIPDKRWENQSFSNIYAFHIESGRKWRVTNKKRLYAPDLNDIASQIACIEFLPKGETQMLILDLDKDGGVQQLVKAPQGESFHNPRWDQNGNIWMLSSGSKGRSIYRYDPKIQKLDLYEVLGWKEVHSLQIYNGNLYFIAPKGAVDAIYKMDIPTKELSLVSSDIYGINYLTRSEDELCASVYRTNGYKAALISYTNNSIDVNGLEDLHEPYLPLIERAKSEQALQVTSSESEFESKKYRKMFHLFKFHSWAPLSIDLSDYNLKPGIMLMSQNDLSSVTSTIGTEYYRTQGRFEHFANIKFSGLAPVINVRGRTYTDQANLNRLKEDTTKVDVKYRNYTASIDIQYPYNFSSGRWQRGFIPTLQAEYTNYNGSSIGESLPFWRTYLNIGAGANIYAVSKKAHRDLFPRLGYILNLTTITQTSFFEGNGKTYLVGSLRSFLPGILNNQSTRIYLGGYLRNEWIMPDQSPILLPRGMYSDFNKYSLSAKLDYSFPIAYPDWNIGSLLYVKRFKANVFFDGAKSLVDHHSLFMTTGIDLSSDFFLFRIGAEIDSGVRLLYNITENKFGAEILFDFAIE